MIDAIATFLASHWPLLIFLSGVLGGAYAAWQLWGADLDNVCFRCLTKLPWEKCKEHDPK